MEFRRVGVCGQPRRNVGSPPTLCGHGQTGLLRNHCDCSWRPATVKEKKKEEKKLLEDKSLFPLFPV